MTPRTWTDGVIPSSTSVGGAMPLVLSFSFLFHFLEREEREKMRPAIKFPRSVSYIEDVNRRPDDASEFYGGQEFHSRSRTYSVVRSIDFTTKLLMDSLSP